MMRGAGTLFILLACALSAGAQDVVRLRNGRHVAGTIAIKPGDAEGFEIQRWDTGATLYVRWSQIPEAEKNRLLNKTIEAAPAGDFLDGIRVLTATREVVGILVKEEATQLLIKTKDSKSPVAVPKNDNLYRRDDNIRIRESDAYSAEEMVDNREKKVNLRDATALLDLARFAAGLKQNERARDFYLKAAAADPGRKDEIQALVEANDILIKEGKAAALLAKIRELAEDTDYAKALEEARKLLGDYADTEVARQNKDLEGALQKEAKDFEVRRAEVLAKRVPELYKSKRSSLISQYAGSRYKLNQARQAVQKADDEIMKDLAKKMKSTVDEIAQAWSKREQKPRTVAFGTGSWIVKGGQDGGMDTDAKFTPKPRNSGSGVYDDYGNLVGGGRSRQQEAKPVDLGKKLQTSEEWWSTASSSERRNFLEAEYAMTSGQAKKVKEETRKCGACGGEGTLKVNRMGVSADAKCPRCHGAKDDVIVQYW